jgi:uncharacterized membrane protein
MGLLLAIIIVGWLVYTKPSFFWNNYQMRRARQGMSDAEADRIIYPFLLGLIVLALVLMMFD